MMSLCELATALRNRPGHSLGRGRRPRIAVTALGIALMLGGCANLWIKRSTSILSESGFVARSAETPRQQEAYAVLPSYKLVGGVVGGRTLYYYKDEARGVVYVGGAREYDRYMEKVRNLVAVYEATEADMAAQGTSAEVQARLPGSWEYVSRSEISKPAVPAASPASQ